jgi:hypothetical protein
MRFSKIKISHLLPSLMVAITKKSRYRVNVGRNFEWSSDNWTHNIFRVWELIAWRKCGIRRESAVTHDGKNEYHYFFTLESLLAHFEGEIRRFFRGIIPRYEKVHIPVLTGTNGINFPVLFGGEYLFAIARDSSVSDAGVNNFATRTVTMTCSGSDRVLTAYPYNDGTTLTVSSFTYDAVSMGTVVTEASTVNGDIRGYLLVAPNTTAGAALTVTYNASSTYIFICAVSYTGAAQTGQPDAFNSGADAASLATITVSVTTVANNCWISGTVRHDNGGTVTGTNAFTVISNPAYGVALHDTNGAITPAGATTVGSTSTATGNMYLSAISVAPAVASGPANLKSYNTNLKANIKSYNTNLIANVKSIDTNV